MKSIGQLAGGVGLVPEQDWDFAGVAASPFGTDPTVASIGYTDGQPDGSAAPLTWGAAAQVRLTADLAAGRVVEKPASTTSRYVTHTQAATTLTVTSPGNDTAATGTVPVIGTTAPLAKVVIADVATDNNDATTLFSATALNDGSFNIPVTVAAGTNVLVVTAMTASGATAQATVTLVNDVVNGTLLFTATDPVNDDNGPGNYAYPTATDFHAGAFDLQQFQVYDTGTTVTFRVQTRDLTPTFGSTNGAQLVDVYVHNPSACDDVDRSRVRVAELFDRRRRRVVERDRGAGLRAAVRRPGRHQRRHDHDQRQLDLALHHVQRRQDGAGRNSDIGLGLHRHVDGPRRLQ